jgi:tetratricopeptide (TPR) repeat protein
LLGQLHEQDNNPPEAEAAYRRCWQIYFDDYAPPSSSTADDSLLLLPKFLMRLGRYQEAVQFLNELEIRVFGPDHGIRNLRNLCYLWAEYGDSTGDYSRSVAAFSKLWGDALVPYEEFEQQIVVYHDSGGIPYESPAAAAESIIVYHHSAINVVFEKSRSSLVALDGLLGPNSPKRGYRLDGYKAEFLREHLAPELGAYFGEVLCKQLCGDWVVAHPLMRSRVALRERKINPFEIGYQVAFFGRQLAKEFDRLAKGPSAG